MEILFRFLKKNWLFIVLGMVIGFLFIKTYPYINQFIKSQNAKRQKIGMVGLYTVDNLPEEILNQISFGLTVFTSNNKTENSPIVKELVIENDNKDFIFTLDTSRQWQDGQKLKPADINYQIAGLNITPVGKDKVKLSLEKSYSPILASLSKPLIKKGIVGLGQLQISNISYQKDFIKSINLVDTIDKNIKKTYVFYDQEEKLIEAYKLGEIDAIVGISSPQDLTDWPKTKITPVSKVDDTYLAVFLNTQKLAQKELRQALAYATPKTPNKEDRCLGPISPSSWAFNNSVKEYNLSPQKAKDLLKDLELPQIELSVINRRFIQEADSIKDSWQSVLGIKVNVTINTQINPDFDAVLALAAIPKDPDQYEFWHSTQATNITKINNPKIDKLLEEGRQTYDTQKRKEIYLEFQKILLEESPAIFLSYPTSFNITRL